MSSLGEELPREMARVRDKIMPVYLAFPEGFIAATMMRMALDAAAKATAEGDVVAMIRAHEELKGFKL